MKTILCVAMFIAMLCLIDGRKHEKKGYRAKYEFSKVDGPSANPFHRGRKHNGGMMKDRRSQLFKKHQGMKSIHDEWMKVPTSSKDCKLECGRGEFCISNKRSGEETCVSRRRFKEGRELFKKFHQRKEMFKGDMKGVDKDLQMVEHMRDVVDLVNDYKKLNRPAHHHTEKGLSVKEQDMLIKEATNIQECRPRELDELKKRLTGYFDMLHTTSRMKHHRRKHMKQHGHADLLAHKLHKRVKRHNTVDIEIHGHCKCSKSVMWDFHKMDADRDGYLEHEELASMARNRREPCIKPLVKSCDTDTDGHLTKSEWCCCLAEIVAPCAEKARHVSKDDWVPMCDKEGYFEREQCHKSGHCWCVDLNGNTIPHTKQPGSAHCGKYGPNGKPIDEQM